MCSFGWAIRLGGAYCDCVICRRLRPKELCELYNITYYGPYADTSQPVTPKPALRPYTSAERKAMPLQKLLAEYFPDAFMAVARHSLKANDKHNPGEPMHWARGKSTDHLDCAARHLLTPDALDPDTGETEAVCLLWRAAAYVQLQEEARLVAAGIMPLSGVVPAP